MLPPTPRAGNSSAYERIDSSMTKLGFLSFGHWQDVPGSRTRTGAEVLQQAIELAVAAEEVGVDGAYFRVHHFARQHASPWPLLAAAGARTSRIELGTGVIDMRYENPLAMAELAAQADLIASGRLQLGISRGSPETAGAHSASSPPRARATPTWRGATPTSSAARSPGRASRPRTRT